MLIIIIGVVAFAAPILDVSWLNQIMNWGLVATTIVLLTVISFFFEFEASAVSAKEIALVGMLGTVSAVSRVPFAAIPNVQPCTYLIICTGYVFGPLAGFMVGAITALVSNFFLGQGPWTPYQMFAWGMVGISAAYLRKVCRDTRCLILFGVIWGYIYGVIMNTWFWASFVYPLTLKTFAVAQLNSIWFDTFHALGNAIFLGVFSQKTIAILERFKMRFSIKYSH
jgi:energy-coupling factor transport system substrate-specific component